jgi:hypothetical protein
VFAIEEVFGVIGVGVHLGEEAEPLVPAFARGIAGITEATDAPFAEHGGGVAGLLEHFGDGEVAGLQEFFVSLVAADAGVAGVEACHQRAAGRGADGAAGVDLGEAGTFGGHAVDVWRLDFLLAVAAEVAVAEIVGEDEDDVGRAALGENRDGEGGQEGASAEHYRLMYTSSHARYGDYRRLLPAGVRDWLLSLAQGAHVVELFSGRAERGMVRRGHVVVCDEHQ